MNAGIGNLAEHGGRACHGAALVRALALFLALSWGVVAATPPPLPNILWLTSEDNGPHLGCYGDAFARTPNLDALAARGMRFDRVWSVAPVCAPARTAIISGLYPASAGAEHMRSELPMPAGFRMYPQFLRAAGYYCSNNSKEDYNLIKPGQVWDDSSPRAHWRNRPSGRPFFAIFNFTETHESQVRRRPHTAVHDPAGVSLPAYHPDAPDVRQDRAQYYDQMTVMDRLAGNALLELEEAGLADDTILFYYGDHGPGLPGAKRSARNSGLQVPLLVHFPPRWRHLAPAGYHPGGSSQRLVSFVDLAPTLLSLAGIRPPAWMQGHAFAGTFQTPAPAYLFGQRGRMDERTDLVRAVTDGRYVYIRNYLPDLPAGQHVAYMFETPTTRVWAEHYRYGRLSPEQAAFWQPRPAEEFYDLLNDADEVRNLAGTPEHRRRLQRFRRALRDHSRRIRDVGFLPEAEMLARAGGDSPYDLARDPGRLKVNDVIDAAGFASDGWRPGRAPDTHRVNRLLELTKSSEAGVRYWAVVGLRLEGEEGVRAAAERLASLLNDKSPSVRVAAGEALGLFGSDAHRRTATEVLLRHADVERNDYFVAVAALQALDRLGSRAADRAAEIRALPTTKSGMSPRLKEYSGRLVEKLRRNLEAQAD